MKCCCWKLASGFIVSVFLFLNQCCAEYLVNVEQFGALADAREINGVWIGTDNSAALNKCAAYCRAKGLTMFFPKGNYGVASTVWLTNPDLDGSRVSQISVTGSNLCAFRGQPWSANICVLKGFKAGRIVEAKKTDGIVKEPNLVPVLGISTGMQVHIQGIGIQGTNKNDLVCGIAIGNVSDLVSVRNCSIEDIYAGIVFPGLRQSQGDSVYDRNNDLLVVEQCTFNNIYNIVCAGTQPFACEYRNNLFVCSRSVFTGTLITNFIRQTAGSHKFSSNLFGTGCDFLEQKVIYFDLMFNNVAIDNCHFETGCPQRQIPETLIRCCPKGGVSYQTLRLSFTNNIVNFANQYRYPSQDTPLFDTLIGNRMIVQGNSVNVATAVRIKSYGGIFIGNAFRLVGAAHNLEIKDEAHQVTTEDGKVHEGLYDFNHFIRKDSPVTIRIPDGNTLREDIDYKIVKEENAFNITERGKLIIDEAKAKILLISYKANDAAQIRFEAWGGNTFNPPNGWWCQDLAMIANKVVSKTDDGRIIEQELNWSKHK
jgi:hypothetical protein